MLVEVFSNLVIAKSNGHLSVFVLFNFFVVSGNMNHSFFAEILELPTQLGALFSFYILYLWLQLLSIS